MPRYCCSWLHQTPESELINPNHFDFHQMPRLHGEPLGQALFRSCPEDFCVDEIMDLQPSGEGEHLLLHIRKRDQNSQWVAGLLASLAGIKRNDIGFCGLKDRFAVTTQWYSLHLPGNDIDLARLEHSDFDILAAHRHHKKLRRGMHQGNQFSIRLRQFEVHPALLDERLRLIEQLGAPNYFAEQRFGHQGNNLREAQRLIDGDQLKGNHRGTGMYLSAARSWIFNLLLERRIAINNLRAPIDGDESAALWGRGRSNTSAEVNKIETAVLADWQSWCYALEHSGLKQERRDLLLRPRGLAWKWVAEDQLQLSFALPNGAYATALLREIAELFRPEFKAL
ncbi:MAG: tRNA pseudouridine(13) synthase TruD [Porticoccaceae bacterium]|nr:tRNA pseudouridine(13) synthase TruD [Porticoccaceae bacterium]